MQKSMSMEKISQVYFKQANPDFFKSANESSAAKDTDYTSDIKDFSMPENTSMIHSDQFLNEANHKHEQPELNVICSQFELKDLNLVQTNSIHVSEPLHFQQLAIEHSQSCSGSNDNPNPASMYSRLQHHIGTQQQKKFTGDSLEMFLLPSD